MKVMKKIFKNSILTFVLGAIIFSGITAYAAGRYYATQVDYEPANPNFNVDNMSDALDQLYTTQNTTISNLNNQVTALTGQVSAKDATIIDLQSQVQALSNSTGFEEMVMINAGYQGGCAGMYYYPNGTVEWVTAGTSSSSYGTYINAYFYESQGKWYVKTKTAGKYAIIYGHANPSVSIRDLPANSTIVNGIADNSLDRNYTAVVVMKLKS